MEPTLHDGDIVVASSMLDARAGHVVVARVGEKDVVKRLASGSGGQMMLRGDNTHTAHDLPLTRKTRIIGRVFWPRV
jgi:phage repressor protein C with HTH and peptisase S24 domain